jgi:hypothetical protein
MTLGKMTLGNMRSLGVRSLAVTCELCLLRDNQGEKEATIRMRMARCVVVSTRATPGTTGHEGMAASPESGGRLELIPIHPARRIEGVSQGSPR